MMYRSVSSAKSRTLGAHSGPLQYVPSKRKSGEVFVVGVKGYWNMDWWWWRQWSIQQRRKIEKELKRVREWVDEQSLRECMKMARNRVGGASSILRTKSAT
ncbi:hypothetical protein FRC02_010154 [Tulasnella sp. 418]|nr:hypothetical protein FRC02_010154 [Tulasnella sp. 418]